ncbi:MAG: hypothetical protein ACREJN_21575 [Nitrospiraceae bacterium]
MIQELHGSLDTGKWMPDSVGLDIFDKICSRLGYGLEISEKQADWLAATYDKYTE